MQGFKATLVRAEHCRIHLVRAQASGAAVKSMELLVYTGVALASSIPNMAGLELTVL